MAADTESPLAVTRAAVVGAGTMGMSLAQWLACAGLGVTLHSRRDDALRSFLARVEAWYARRARRGKIGEAARHQRVAACRGTTTYDGCEAVHIVIEATVEDLAVKQRLIHTLDRICPPETMLATNTSALSISEIAAAATHPERVLGLHFFQPVRFTSLVEVIPGRHTSRAVVARAMAFLTQRGKRPLQVQDAPGFLVNRVLGAYLMEAMRLVEAAGYAPAAIDRALVDWGMPLGPLQLADRIGLDVLLDVARVLERAYGQKFHGGSRLPHYVATGRLGTKVGRGIYAYDARGQIVPVPTSAGHRSKLPTAQEHDVVERLLAALVTEALLCAQEGLAAPADVQRAVLAGLHLPKGPWTIAEDLGLPRFLTILARLATTAGERFQAPPRLVECVAAGQTQLYPPHNGCRSGC